MDIERLRALVRTARSNLGMTQDEAAEAAGISVCRWQNLEMEGSTRRTSIRLPQDRELIDAVAQALGRDDGLSLMREAGIV